MSREKSAFVCSDGKTTKALKALLKPDDPKICSVVKDLGVDSSGGARRRVAQQTQRLQKAGKRNKRLQRLKVKRKAVTTRICNVSILTAGTWGHQAQGLAPSKIRVLRGVASGPVRIGLGSCEVVFDMQDSGVKDPFSKVVQEHWSTFAKCMIRNKSEAQRVGKAWEYTWKHLSKARHPWRKCAGPIGAMICYLKEPGFEAADLSHWKRQGRSIHIKWGDLASIRMARQELIASQTGGAIEAPL